MAKPSLAQEQTVEEILASIRQVINGEQPRSAPIGARPEGPPPRRPPAAAGPSRLGSTVTPIYGGKVAAVGDEASADPPPDSGSPMADTRAAAPTGEQPSATEPDPEDDGVPMHDVIESAIEQALGGLDPERTRAERGDPGAPEARASLRPTIRPPRAEPRPPLREAPRSEPYLAPRSGPHQAAREAPHQPNPSLPQSPLQGLLSVRANAAVAASFDDLARVLASRGAGEIDRTVEDLLRPMLKAWLDDNLPSLVERLVREEIERVSRGGR